MLIRKLFRTALKYKAQFISMLIMIAIGVGVFLGFHIEWYSIEKNVNEFHAETLFADFRVYNEEGFSREDIQRINEIDNVEAIRALQVNVDVKDSEDSLSLFVPENDSLSTMLITSGEDYSEDREGFWLSDKYAKANDIEVGDTLTITYRGMDIEGKVLGLGKSGEYTVCVADENQLMPNFNTYGFIYATPQIIFDKLGMEFYSQVNIISDMTKAEMEDELSGVLGKTTLVTDKEENYSYAGPMSEVEEGQTMGSILPVLFLAIAILTMVTTMHRIAANEKTQIGTLKALGFRDYRILRHYTSYGVMLGLIGSVLGIVLGFLIAFIIINPDGMMGTYIDMPNWTLYMPDFCIGIIVLVIVFMALISFISVKKMLSHTAAETLRAYTPKKMKSLMIERTKLWDRFSFSVRWNMRDLMRHKARSFMTLFGIIGCMLLLVGGIGMKDTMDGFLKLINKEISNYTTRINITENADESEVEAFANEVDGDTLSASTVKIEDKAVALEIYDISKDMVRFVDEDNKRTKLTDEGAYVCVRLSEDYKVGDVIEFSPYGSEYKYKVEVVGVLRSVTSENIVMTETYAKSVGIPCNISAIFTDMEQGDISDRSFISGKQSKEALIESYSSFMEIMNIMVIIFVLAAIVLGGVVLYNLGVMSYIERSREMATLKVVGFRDRHIGRILISQNIWLTALGVIIGLPSGIGVLHILIISLMNEYELKLTLGTLTYSISIILTFGVSFVVGLFVSAKNKHIDMVEALKGVE